MADIKNLKKAAKRIQKAIKKNERIILYGDSDLDGVTSVLILEETIKTLGGTVAMVCFPDWETEDYGLNKTGLKVLAKYPPALLVLLDCGIANFKEVKQAKEMGFDVIVIDHHEIIGRVPSCALVVDPKQPGDKHPFKRLSTASLIYELCWLLLDDLSPALNQNFTELAALGTIADMMPEEGTNGLVVASGLRSIRATFRPGLKAIIEASVKIDAPPRAIFQRLVAVLNICDLESHLTQSYLLLTERDWQAAKGLAEKLFLASEKRNRDIWEAVEDISERIEGSPSPLIFEGSSDWIQVLSGSIASRICNKYKKPTFIFKIKPDRARGSVRMPKGLDAVAALKACDKYLDMYGGHPPAAGFTVKNENLDGLRKCLENYFLGLSDRSDL